MTEYPSTVLVKVFLYVFYNFYDYRDCVIEIFEKFSEIGHFLTSYGWTLERWYGSLTKLFFTGCLTHFSPLSHFYTP